MLEVASWLDERRGMIATSEGLFQQLDEEEGAAAGKQWLGLDLDAEAIADLREARRDWETGARAAFVPLSEL